MAEDIPSKNVASIKRLEIKRYGYNFTFLLNSDESECSCLYEPLATGGSPLTDSELQQHLSQFKISEGILPEVIVQLLNSAASGESVKDLLFARGIPMTPGEDGKLAIAVRDELESPKEETDSETEKNSKVDFRHVQSFLNVDVGDLIATILPPGKGIPGKTVTGKIIPSQSGKPVTVQLGQKVRSSQDGTELYAEEAGRVCQEGDTISVEQIYEIDGDVGFKVGNIVFNGYLVIKGDVLDDFSIKAAKGITITGNIGVCRIESDGDISFCGMNGQEKGSILCGGSIKANFIYESVIECSGDVVVETEIRNSHIKCLGSILVNKGGVVGGDYSALAGVQAAVLGSVTSLHTRVIAAVHYRDQEELNSLFNELKQLVAEYSSAKTGNIDMKEFARRRMEITDKTQEIRLRVYESSNAKINVANKLYEGVVLTLGMINENIKEEHKGPMSIIENSIDGGLRFLGMTPLSFNAKDIEQTFVSQHEMEQRKKLNDVSEDKG